MADIVQYARQMGFETVAINQGSDKAPLARKLGAHHYIDASAQDAVTELQKHGALAIVAGPKKMTFALKHYDRDVCTYETVDENAGGMTGVIFTIGAAGKASTVRVEHFNVRGEGTFTRGLDENK